MKLSHIVAVGAVTIVAAGGCTSDKIVTAKGEYVQVQRDSREMIQRTTVAVCEKYRAESKALLEKKDFAAIKTSLDATEIADRIKRLKKPEEQMTDGDLEAARRLVQDDYEKFVTEVVYPAWAAFIMENVDKKVKDLVAAGKFEEAREVAWTAPMTDCEPVNALVRKACVDLLRADVNPVQWPLVEKELKELAARYLDDEDRLEEGRDAVTARRPERAYSREIDRQLAAVVASAVKIGAEKDALNPVVGRTRELLDAAANLVDELDESKSNVTTKVVTAASSPDLKAYDEELAKYRKDLLKFDCTKENADAVVKAVDAIIRPQLLSLARQAVSESTTTTTLRLGITALNARLAKLKTELVGEFDKRIAAREQRKLEAKIAALRKRVEALVAGKKYDEAREVSWAAAAEDARLRTTVVELVAVAVNPVQWAGVEDEFAKRTEAFVKAAQFDQAIAWLAAYPTIRTYAQEIDARLDDVGARARKLGVPETNVAEVVRETQNLAAEVARLVDNTDTFKSDLQKVPFSEADLKDVLSAYRAALVRNDCTEENADKLVKETYDGLYKAFLAAHPDIERGYLVLGCNAYNARLAKLVAEKTAQMVEHKCRHIIDGLVKAVTAAVRAGDFAKARALIRETPLMNDAACDARIYTVRIGLLNSVVNPAQVEPLLAEIRQKEKTLLKADKCQELLDWVESYAFVKDLYADLEATLKALKGAAVGLEIAEGAADEYVDRLGERLHQLLDKREGAWLPEGTDFKPMGKALENLDKAIATHYCDKTVIDILTKKIDEEMHGLWKDRYAPLTTWELNEKLSARLLAVKDAVLKHKAFCDSQIAIAEAAIVEQLRIDGPEGRLDFNAVLGDYARAMRLRKLGGELNADMLKALTLGSVYLGSKAVLDCALARGANVDSVSARDPLARTPLLLALQLGRADFVAQLLAAGAKANAVDAQGNGAVHYAVARGSLELVWQVLERGCDVNLKNKAGETPLYTAVRKDQQGLVCVLTKSPDPKRAVAKANVKNAAGETPFDVACQVGARDSLDALLAAGSTYGADQLVLAVSHRRLAVVRWLVNRGVDVNAPGVMQAARDGSDVKAYLVSQGGIPLACQAPCCRPPDLPEEKAKKSAEAAGTLTFKVTEAQ